MEDISKVVFTKTLPKNATAEQLVAHIRYVQETAEAKIMVLIDRINTLTKQNEGGS